MYWSEFLKILGLAVAMYYAVALVYIYFDKKKVLATSNAGAGKKENLPAKKVEKAKKPIDQFITQKTVSTSDIVMHEVVYNQFAFDDSALEALNPTMDNGIMDLTGSQNELPNEVDILNGQYQNGHHQNGHANAAARDVQFDPAAMMAGQQPIDFNGNGQMAADANGHLIINHSGHSIESSQAANDLAKDAINQLNGTSTVPEQPNAALPQQPTPQEQPPVAPQAQDPAKTAEQKPQNKPGKTQYKTDSLLHLLTSK
jgi:hypothetical protein